LAGNRLPVKERHLTCPRQQAGPHTPVERPHQRTYPTAILREGGRRNQQHPTMITTISAPLVIELDEVRDIARDQHTLLTTREVEDEIIGQPSQLRAFDNPVDIQSESTQRFGKLRTKHFVEQQASA
jgi:hypothetical protein